MIDILVQKCDIKVSNTETLASGTANVLYVRFATSEHWSTLHKTAVFTNGEKTIAVLDEKWTSSNVCAIPHEVLEEPGRLVRVGLRGTWQNDIILSTPMVSIGKVIPGTDAANDASTDPSLPVWEQLREDFSKRSYDCSTVLEKYRDEAHMETVLRVRLLHPENIPESAELHLYHCTRSRGPEYHWRHPLNWNGKPKEDRQRWGYGLIAGKPVAYGIDRPIYPAVPDWMPNEGYMRTEIPITAWDKKSGFIDISLATCLLPLLKPVDEDLTWSNCGFIGLSGDGRRNSLLLRFRICKNGEPVDLPGNTLRIGFRRKLTPKHTHCILSENRIATGLLYTSIQ